jgi:hypothetical protein
VLILEPAVREDGDDPPDLRSLPTICQIAFADLDALGRDRHG